MLHERQRSGRRRVADAAVDQKLLPVSGHVIRLRRAESDVEEGRWLSELRHRPELHRNGHELAAADEVELLPVRSPSWSIAAARGDLPFRAGRGKWRNEDLPRR